jgi:hypothetical protein
MQGKNLSLKHRTPLTALLFAGCFMMGCSNSQVATQSSGSSTSFSLSLAATSISMAPNSTSSVIQASVNRSGGNQNSVSLSTSGSPAGVTVSLVQPLLGNYGSVGFTSAAATSAGQYPITITASDGAVNASSTLTLTVLPSEAISISPSSSALIARQDGTAASDTFSISRTSGYGGAITVTASGLPSGLAASLVQPGAGTSGSVTFTTNATPVASGSYNVTLTASDGAASGSCVVTVTVEIVAKVANGVNTSQGLSGQFAEFMSTGFQPSTYDNPYFVTFPSTSNLAALNSEHIRIQTVQNTTPWITNSTSQQASDWSFTAMDQTVQPVLATGDKSPIFQVAAAPLFLCDTSGHFIFTTTNLQLLSSYAQNLVRYYNTGGFTWGGKHFQSSSPNHITWWAIFNEPNLNNVTAAQYVQLYNTLVPAMLSVDPTLKFVALELSDYTGQPQAYVPQLVLPAASGGISAQINAISTHFYGSCNQTTTDAATFAKVAQFAADIGYFRKELQTRSDLANVPVWVTENNVNSDYNLPTGYSNCNPNQLFVSDARGTNAFFTAWRPFVFSQLGKAGNQALYHFLYEGSLQYGEVSNTTNATTLAYWTDYWLQRVFPWDGSSTGSTILNSSTTEPTPSIEFLAVENADNSVSLMVSDIAPAASADDNGAGSPRTVLIDISAMGNFSTANQINLNATTSAATGPTMSSITPSSTLQVTLPGYGTSFFVLKR